MAVTLIWVSIDYRNTTCTHGRSALAWYLNFCNQLYTTAINALQRKTLKLKSPEILYLSYFMWFLATKSRWIIYLSRNLCAFDAFFIDNIKYDTAFENDNGN